MNKWGLEISLSINPGNTVQMIQMMKFDQIGRSVSDAMQMDSPIYCWLVVSTPLKNIKVSWDDYSQHTEK